MTGLENKPVKWKNSGYVNKPIYGNKHDMEGLILNIV